LLPDLLAAAVTVRVVHRLAVVDVEQQQAESPVTDICPSLGLASSTIQGDLLS